MGLRYSRMLGNIYIWALYGVNICINCVYTVVQIIYADVGSIRSSHVVAEQNKSIGRAKIRWQVSAQVDT
ncbi:hypothetical protein ACS0TY_031699 [Phlomoides rotata]